MPQSPTIQATDIEGIWQASVTNVEGNQAVNEEIWAFSIIGNELEYVLERDGNLLGCPVTIDGTEISFFFQEGTVTVTVTGEVESGSMTGTWEDDAGSSGTWQADKGLILEDTQTTVYDSG